MGAGTVRSRDMQLLLVGTVGFAPALLASSQLSSWHNILSLAFAGIIAICGFRWTVYLVPKLEGRLLKAGLSGKDINKRGTEAGDRPVPESLGLAPGIPMPIVKYLGLEFTYLELGFLYYVYMAALVIFCTNSINILAGVNGLEVGQSFFISAAVLTFNILRLIWFQGSPLGASALFSSYVMMPLAATSFGLLQFNWYPSQVFVGDTYTYFAGMTIAVAGILGHFSETLLIFLLPQLFNFVYSIPQLFGMVHCPRHRLPTFNPKTGLLTATPNWNLVNLTLQIGGPCSELWLCIRILFMQVLCGFVGLACNVLLKGSWKS